jgi:molecular chaperone HscB
MTLQCPSCGREQEPQLICQQCGMPLPVELDCFAALGLPRKLTIDLPALEERYHELGKKIHPDRFASSPPRIRSASLSGAALLTRSYRTLRDPVSRGLYWLELNGEKLAENNKQVPAELAETVFEVQEQLAEMRGAGAGDEALRRAVEKRRIELGLAMDELRERLARNFARWDRSDGSDRAELIAELKSTLSKIAYMRTLIRDVDRELDSPRMA